MGSNFFQGVQLFPGGGGGGSNCLFPIETHITCDFPGGGGPDHLSPSGSALAHLKLDIWPYCSHTALVWVS